MNHIMERIGQIGIAPVVVLEDRKDAVPLVRAMAAGGIPCAEITLRTAAGLDSIAAAAELDEDILVGAGSVLDLAMCRNALSAGAKFIVSPGFDPQVAEYCLSRDAAVLPGCITPSEIMSALHMGLDAVKFFPANIYGGSSAIKALHGPFPNLRFVPTGGISATNLAEYLAVPYVHAVGGSWLCARKDIAAGDFERITSLCAQASAHVQAVRGDRPGPK